VNDIVCPFPEAFFVPGPNGISLLPRGPLRFGFPFLPDGAAFPLMPAAAVAAAINSKFDGMSTVSGKFDILSDCLSSSVTSNGSGFAGLGLARFTESSFADDEDPPAVAPFVG
jgi:hypothetical protein